MNPVRNDLSAGLKSLQFNQATNEITFGNVGSVGPIGATGTY